MHIKKSHVNIFYLLSSLEQVGLYIENSVPFKGKRHLAAQVNTFPRVKQQWMKRWHLLHILTNTAYHGCPLTHTDVAF